MAPLWLTYAWKDNENHDVDFIAQELRAAGITVKLLGTRESDTVLDPFGGSGTTGAVARELSRKAILIELNPSYTRLSKDRLRNGIQKGFGV